MVDLVNGWSSIARRVAGEEGQPYPRFAQLSAAHGLDPAGVGADPQDADLVLAADALYPAFSATSDQEVAAQLNALLATTAPSPTLAQVGGQLADGWAVRDRRQGLLAGCALALRRRLTECGNCSRLGVCSGAGCADVYVDASPAGHKRFCDVTCQNRARVSAFRRARRDSARSPGR